MADPEIPFRDQDIPFRDQDIVWRRTGEGPPPPPPPPSEADAEHALSRTPVAVLAVEMDRCERRFGVAPCTATGEPCYQTRGTCKALQAYLRGVQTLLFSSADTALPFDAARPYLQSISYRPTEIATHFTVAGRVRARCADEPDSDIDIDPYLTDRAAPPQGTYWGRFIARNPHYRGRTARLYSGYLGEAEYTYVERWRGSLDNIVRMRGAAELEIVDRLRALDRLYCPAKLDIKLASNITADQTSITLTSVDGLDPGPGAVRIGEELIYYTGANPATHVLSGCSRGWESERQPHDAGSAVGRVRILGPMSPWDILWTLLVTDAGIPQGDIDGAAFWDCKTFPEPDISMQAIITEPTKISELYFELVDLLDCKSWIGENLKITIRRNLPNRPGRRDPLLTDAEHIVDAPATLDLNGDSRISRVLLYWDKPLLARVDEYQKYNRLHMAVDTDAESAAEYNAVAEKTIGCRWVRWNVIPETQTSRWLARQTMRRVWMQRDPQPLLTVQVERKDSSIKTGDYLRLQTDELCTPSGAPSLRTWQVVRREPRGETFQLTLLRQRAERFAYIAANGAGDYAAATDEERNDQAYLSGPDGTLDGDPGYYLW